MLVDNTAVCNFRTQVANAEDAGAIAVIVAHNTPASPPFMSGSMDPPAGIPAVITSGVKPDSVSRALAGEAPRRIDALGERLLDGLLARVPGTSLNGDRARRSKAIVNVRFEGVDGEAVLHELDLAGITVSTGSACSAATPGPSHVLMALGLRPEDAHASVRFSLGEGNDDSDVERIVSTTAAVVERLRAMGRGNPAAAERVAQAGA